MPPVIFRLLNDNPAFQTIKQGKNASEVKGILTETATEISTRHWRRGCFASGYLASDYRRLNTSFFIKETRQALDNYRQQLKNARDRIHPQDNTSGLMKGFIRGIELLVSQPSPPEKVLKAGNQSARLPANILANTRSAMKKAGYHPDDEGMCYGLAWTALLACVRQDGQAYMQRMQYLAQMDTPPLPGTGDTHQIYPFFDAVTLSVTNYKNMSGYEKGIGYPGRQEVAFPGRIIGGHEPDYQVPVVKQTFIAECTPETFIRFLQHTRKNNKGIPFGIMIHYPGHATSIGFDGSKWLATNHDSHYYTETTEQLYSFLDEQSDHYKNGKIIAAMEVVSGNDFSLKITRDALVINAKKSVSAPLALHMALRYGDVNVTTDCITAIIQQAHSPEILLERLACKDARGTPGLYMALQKGQSDAITAFMQASTAVVAALSLPEVQKAELLYRLFSSKNACLHPCAQRHPQENTGDRHTSRKRLSPEQADVEAKRSKANAQTRPQETTGNSIPSRKRTPPEQKDSKAKRNKRSATVEGKQGDNLQGGTTAQGSRIENTEPEGQITIDASAGLEVLKSYFHSGMNDKESEAAKKLFQVLNSKKIKIKETFHKMLANNMDRKDLPSFCAKASVFFGALSENIKDTGCLTSILGNKKKNILDFIEREDAELEYLARLDTFRCFSSMNNRKGIPKKEAVEDMLDWKVWKPKGVFSMELFRAFSSINHGKGLPEKEAVEAMLAWDVWKPEGVFSMELFRAFSSMSNGHSLPKKEAVEAMLNWEVWKLDGVFSMELFRAFSSMNNGKGLPKKEAVEEVLAWEVWKPDGVFSMELFRAFSSMNCSKGLLKKEAVKTVLGWKVWKAEGVFNLELFRTFSSMNSKQGLPKKEEVEAVLNWDIWKSEGVFSMELFRAFSSMNHGKGLPKKETVEAVLAWECWKLDGAFSMELFRSLSSMNNGKGLPKKEAMEAVLGWDVWKPEGVFSMELFRAVSSMNHGKGLPKKETVEEMLDWFRCENKSEVLLFKLATRLHISEGIPDIKKLKQYEQKLLNLFFADSIIGHDNNDKDKLRRLIQPVVLFLSIKKPQYVLNFIDVEHFYQQVAGEPDSKLEKLLKLLISYGGKGVSRYLTLNNDHREALIELSLLQAPLPLTMQAVTDFSPQERKLYLFFTRNLKAPPDKDQWSDLGLQLRRLASVLKTPNNQRRYLEIIWHLAPSDRKTFLNENHAACIITVFPSLSALEKLAKSYSQSGLKALFKACKQFIQENLSRENIKRLFAALLETRLFLCVDDDLPDHFLSEYTAVEGSATFIAVTPETGTAEKLALYFVASVTRVLSRMFYYREANRLKIRLCEGRIESFQIPVLEIQDKGIKISNWPVWMFLHFLAVTEFPKSCYFSQEDWQQYCNPMFPLSLTQDKSETPTNPTPVTVEETLSEEEQFQRLWENLSWKAVLEDGDLQLLTGYEQYMTMDHIVKILEKVHTSVEPHKLDKLKQLLDEKKTLRLIDDLFPPLSDEVINYLMEKEISWIPE